MIKADQNVKENKGLVKLDGLEGLWYEQPDMLSKYKRRPDSLEKIVSSHYAKIIRTGGKGRLNGNSKEKGPDEEEYEDIS